MFDAHESRMVKKSVNYSPALLKLFDEILVNAADNAQRKEKMSKIAVSIDQIRDGDGSSSLEIRIRNDGQLIPIVKHLKDLLCILKVRVTLLNFFIEDMFSYVCQKIRNIFLIQFCRKKLQINVCVNICQLKFVKNSANPYL